MIEYPLITVHGPETAINDRLGKTERLKMKVWDDMVFTEVEQTLFSTKLAYKVILILKCVSYTTYRVLQRKTYM